LPLKKKTFLATSLNFLKNFRLPLGSKWGGGALRNFFLRLSLIRSKKVYFFFQEILQLL